MNDNLLLYVETNIFDNIDNETIMQHFQNIKTHGGQLENIFNRNVINQYNFFVFIIY